VIETQCPGTPLSSLGVVQLDENGDGGLDLLPAVWIHETVSAAARHTTGHAFRRERSAS
jgi:hypothetical protein